MPLIHVHVALLPNIRVVVICNNVVPGRVVSVFEICCLGKKIICGYQTHTTSGKDMLRKRYQERMITLLLNIGVIYTFKCWYQTPKPPLDLVQACYGNYIRIG